GAHEEDPLRLPPAPPGTRRRRHADDPAARLAGLGLDNRSGAVGERRLLDAVTLMALAPAERRVVDAVPRRLLIGGAWRDGANASTFDVHDPRQARCSARSPRRRERRARGA